MRITFPLRMALIVAAAVTFLHQNATATTIVDLGAASGFAVLAGAGITVAGAVNSTTITGDIGTYPTPSITGLGNVVLHGVNQTADSGLMLNALNALNAAFIDAIGRPVTTSYGPIHDLGGSTLTSGVYYDPSSFGLTGTLTLDAKNDPDAVWIFHAGSTLTTASSSSVVFKDGVGSACNVFWVVGSDATIGTYSDFVGNILAWRDITLNTGATVDGRVLAGANEISGAVTLDNNTIDKSDCTANGGGVPDPGSTLLLLGSGLGTLLAFKRRFFSPA